MDSMWAIKIRSKDADSLLDLIFNEHLDISCGGPTRSGDGFLNSCLCNRGKKRMNYLIQEAPLWK